MNVATRRSVLGGALGVAAAYLTGGCADAATRRRRRPDLVRDRLWLWGHGTHTLDGEFNIPDGPAMGMAKAAAALGVPNLCVIRWMGKPASPFGRFAKTLQPLGKVGWSVVDSAPETTQEKIDMAFALADRVPNMTTLYLDDLFVQPVKITPEQMVDLRARATARGLELAAVLYVSQLTPAITELLQHVDVVSLWAWDGADIDRWEDNLAAYRELLPDMRTLLGVYMWDFGASAPIGAARMQHQLDQGLSWLRSGEIEGLIFHSSPLVERPIREVEIAKRWIERNGAEVVTRSPSQARRRGSAGRSRVARA